MNFIKYNSIENATNKTIEHFKTKHPNVANGKFYITEKIHGANFSVYVSKDEIKFAKRTDFLSDNSSFFSFQRLKDKHNFKIIQDSNILKQDDVDYLIIYGELCGGSYPYMPVIPNVSKVQKEIAYSNDIEFVVFDIVIVYKSGNKIPIGYYHIVSFCNKYKLNYTPMLFEGTLDECLEWSSKHKADESEIYKLFNMPKLDIPNIREGHVIKPMFESFFKESRLCIFKDKNEKFKERENATNSEKPIAEYSIEFNDKLNELDSMICINRFNNVVSKFGDYTIKNFRDIMTLLYEDIVEEADISKLSEIDQHNLKRMLLNKVGKFLADNKQELF